MSLATLSSIAERRGGVAARETGHAFGDAAFLGRAFAAPTAQELSRSLLQCLPGEVAVLDADERVVAANEAWLQAARRSPSGADPSSGAGCGLAPAAVFGRGAGAVLEGVRAVLAGERSSFETTYRDDDPEGAARHYRVTVAGNARGGAVVVRTDVTELELTKSALEASARDVRELRAQLEAERACLEREHADAGGFDEFVGTSPALARVREQVQQVAATGASVLVLGETGTGKELAARALHARSPRRERPLVTVNCAALPATLVESELFGYEKGAFTGAAQRTIGRFELAHGGTLFLDEIGELPLEVQGKLLRVLQTGEFERLGSPKTIRTDVRLIAATNRDLAQEVREGRFRADLFYRLSVFPIALPPLRERAEDVPLLVWHVIARRQASLRRSVRQVPEAMMRALTTYAWPGNVRELENVIERALILTSGPTLAADPAFLDGGARPLAPGAFASLADAERAHIRAVLEECAWKLSGRGNAAERLGLKRTTLQFRMKKLGLERPRP